MARSARMGPTIYLKIYSDTPVNISDATFSDASEEKSHRSKSRLANSSVSVLSVIASQGEQ